MPRDYLREADHETEDAAHWLEVAKEQHAASRDVAASTSALIASAHAQLAGALAAIDRSRRA